MDIGVTSWSLPRRGPDAPACAAAFGFSHLHLDFDDISDPAAAAELHHAAKKARISLAALSISPLEQDGFTRAPLHQAVTIADALDIPMIYLPCFGKADLRHAETHRSLRICLTDLRASFRGMIAIESLATARQIKALLRPLPSGARILLDTQNPSMAGLCAAELALETHDLLAPDVHIKDGTDALGNAPVGAGNAQVARTLAVLQHNHFTGRLTLETDYARYPHLDPAQDIAFLRAFFAQARVAPPPNPACAPEALPVTPLPPQSPPQRPDAPCRTAALRPSHQ